MTGHNQPVHTLLMFIASTKKTGAVIFCMLVRAVASFVTAQNFFAIMYKEPIGLPVNTLNLLFVDKGNAVLHEQVFTSLSV